MNWRESSLPDCGGGRLQVADGPGSRAGPKKQADTQQIGSKLINKLIGF